jgi:hypothetical protein
MSTISSASTLYSTLFPSSTSTTSTQDATTQALSELGSALQSGNAAQTQAALTAVQKVLLPNTPSASSSPALPIATAATTTSSSPFGSDSQANADYKSLVGAINSGNLTDAQSALSNLQSDLKVSHGGKHHGHGGPPPPSDTPAPDTSSATDSDSTSGNYVNVTV